jgi:GDP/UDP-N,N'-diacetylbacillosamine 2-epimerase (hydrolysing)
MITQDGIFRWEIRMSIKKRILAFTAIRSDYDLMSGLYQKINSDSDMELGLIVSGAHLSDTYGKTVTFIEESGLPIVARIECLLDSNSTAARLKSASILLQSCIHDVINFRPDVIIYPGDREETLVGSLIGGYLEIPTIHFFGGDHASDGNVDNAVRHAVSKLSSLHFVTHEIHKQRLLKLGESASRIFTIGNPALDAFIQAPFLSKMEVTEKMGRPNWTEYALVVYHPILGHQEHAGAYFQELLCALKQCGKKAFISYPNIDAGNKSILSIIQKYQADEEFCFYKNVERSLFINLMRNAQFMIGNSSAGILEAPAIPLAVVNVGARQRGRLAADNVLFVDEGLSNIRNGIAAVCSFEFQQKLKKVSSIYGAGNSVDIAYQLIKELDFKSYQEKREDPLV